MKKILCFGDSNVYGYIPKNGGRYAVDVRWSGLLKNYFKKQFEIIEAGCNNRVTFDNKTDFNQSSILCLDKYLSFDFYGVIFCLGINDLQKVYNFTENELYLNYDNLIKQAKKICKDIKILIISPAKLNPAILEGFFATLFDETSIKKSNHVEEIYKKCAKENNCEFIDLNKYVKTSQKDGLHFDESEHKIIFEIVKKTINKWY